MTNEERTKKIKELENRIFSLNMIDYWTERQFELSRKLEKELSELKKVAWQNQKLVIILIIEKGKEKTKCLMISI